MPSHYLNQCWCGIVNWTPRNKLQWNRNRNSYIFIQENAFQIVVWKMAAILSRPQCVNLQCCLHLTYSLLPDSITEAYIKGHKGHIYPPPILNWDVAEMGFPSFDLTHWWKEKQAEIIQTTFLNTFSKFKLFYFQIDSRWILFLGMKLTMSQWVRWWHGAFSEPRHCHRQCLSTSLRPHVDTGIR